MPDGLLVAFCPSDHSPERWLAALRAAGSAHRFLRPDEIADPALVDVVLIAAERSEALAAYPRARLIQSLWMGIDSLLADPRVPGEIPVARMVDPGMVALMREAALAHVLAAHRLHDAYRLQQQAATWRQLPPRLARDRRVGVLGFGELGRTVSDQLVAVGFDVAAWSRSPQTSASVSLESGPDGLASLLGRSEIVVNLLPLTPQTRGILNAARFAALPAGAVVINLGRGGHLVDADLLAALDVGHLRHAYLDVFEPEPLPAEHAFWRHAGVTVMPHVAAPSTIEGCVPVIIENLDRVRDGRPPLHLVERSRGY